MNIATALNKRYVRYTIVMLTSLCINNDETIHAYLLHHELDDSDIQLFEESLKGYDIYIHPLKIQRELFSDRLPRTAEWSIETYYRLLLTEVLPEEVDRLLYLDVDMIINQSLKELYYMDFKEKEIIATVDSGGYYSWEDFDTKRQTMFAPMIAKEYQYINAGFMLWNIKRMRERYNFSTYLQAFEDWNYEMSFPDQDIINYVHWKNVGYVDYEKYDLCAGIAHVQGVTYEHAKEHVAVIHYTGEKPWENKNYHFPIQQLWWDYAKKTPLYMELLEDYLRQTIFDDTMEKYIRGLFDDINNLQEQCSKAMQFSEKLLGMLNQ